MRAAAGRAVRAQCPVCGARYRRCGVSDAESVPFVAPGSPFGGSGHFERADAVRHGPHPVREPHPPNAGRCAAGAFRRRVFGDHCGSGGIRGAFGHAVSGRACVGGVGRFGAFPIPQAALRAVPDAPCGRRDGVLPWLCLRVGGRTGPKPRALPSAQEFVRPRDGTGKQDCGSRAARRRPARVGPFVVGLRPVRSGGDPYARRPPCETVRAAGGNLILVCGPSGRRTPGEHLHGAVPQGTRRTEGRGSGKRRHRYRRMAGPPLRDGADALRTARPEVGTAGSDGKVAYRNGFVTDPDVTQDNVAEIAACGPGEVARQRARRPPGARKRASGHIRTPPMWSSPHGPAPSPPPSSASPTRRRPDTSKHPRKPRRASERR